MSIISNIASVTKTAFTKINTSLTENKVLESDTDKRTQKAILIYLGSQVVDKNLHPLSRAYAGALLPFVTRNLTPRKKLLCAVAGTAWMFSKNKKAGFIRSAFASSIALSSVRPTLEEELQDIHISIDSSFIDNSPVIIEQEGEMEVKDIDGTTFTMPNISIKFNAIVTSIPSQTVTSALKGELDDRNSSLAELIKKEANKYK